MSYQEILRTTARVMGRREPFIVPVPVLTPRLSSYWVGLMTDVDFRVARPLIDGLKNPVVVRDDTITRVIDIEQTPYREAVRRALGVSDYEPAVGVPA
jgi:predicted N-formylglutamate amidohydrolase